MKNVIILCSIIVISTTSLIAQKKSYDLQQLLKENQLTAYKGNIVSLTDGKKKGISMTGLAYLKDVTFSTGRIDVDLRGKDVFQKSFIGIAFHGVDTITTDIIYFRPFNFQSTDPVRKIHAVQYVSEPEFPWHKLREEKNGVYEKAATPAPAASDWFHATIVVEETQIRVYVTNAVNPSLTVNKLNSRRDGKIGLWNNGLEGDFANLTISK